MNAMRYRNAARLAIALALVTLSTARVSAATQLSMNDGGKLTLETSTPKEVAGRFERDKQVATFRSTSSGDGEEFELRDDHRTVITLSVTNDRVRVALFGDELVATSKRRATPAFDLEGSGKEATLTALRNNPAYKILPYLAIELVHREITGDKVPAARAIHGIALASARAQGLIMPALQHLASKECTDLEHDPNHDECYGMCGNSCTCWSAVCGTCCGCEGCQTHDWACRVTDCKKIHLSLTQRLAYHEACLTFAAFFIPEHPCDRYPNHKYAPPCK